MYLYLYDNFLNAPNYHKVLSRIEMRLTDLGIGGKICRVSPLKNIHDLIADEIRFGTKTIIAVGNDETISMVVNNIADYDNITFGIIPIGKGSTIARSLGIPEEELACDIISARRLEKLDLGRVNNTYFLSGISIAAENEVELECEGSYQIIPQIAPCVISICNLRPALAPAAASTGRFNPRDGFLEAFIQPTTETPTSMFSFMKKAKPLNNTVIPFKKISVNSKKAVTVTTDGKKVLKPPVEIHVVPKKLSVIVGKERTI